MGLFNLFGGKRKDEAKPAPAKAEAAPMKAQPAKAPAKPAKGKVGAVAPEVLGLPVTAPAQVKLRLKVALSLRTNRASVAYEAARELAAIQAKAGRRVCARKWSAEAERIKASDPALKEAA